MLAILVGGCLLCIVACICVCITCCLEILDASFKLTTVSTSAPQAVAASKAKASRPRDASGRFTSSNSNHPASANGKHHKALPVRARAAPGKAAHTAPDQVRPEDPRLSCAVCMEGVRDTVLRPCGHTSTCSACFIKLRKATCPECNKPIQDKVRIFL